MPNAPSYRQIAEKLAFATRLKRTRVEIKGYDPDRTGYVIVELNTGDGIAIQQSVKMQAVMSVYPGAMALMGLDKARDPAVLGPDFDGQVEAGANPLVNNPADRNIFGGITQDQFATLACHAISTATTPSTIVVIRPWVYVFNGTWHILAQYRQDLSSYFPSTGEHRLAGIWINPADETIAVSTSTPKNLLDQLDVDDFQELQDGVDADAVPAAFWRLYGDQTEVVEADKWIDARQLINTIMQSGGGGGTSLVVDDGITTVDPTYNLHFNSDYFEVEYGGYGLANINWAGDEAIQDMIVALLQAGVGVNLNYNDGGNTLTLTGLDYLRQPCRVASSANVSISSAPASIDGVTLSSGDRILLTGQSTGSQNGVWVFNGTGNPMTRPTDYAAGSTILAYVGLSFHITEGTLYKGSIWRLTTTGSITIDADSTSWVVWDLRALSFAVVSSNLIQALISSDGSIVINEQGNDADSRIEGVGEANFQYWDASLNRIGINTGTPGAQIDVVQKGNTGAGIRVKASASAEAANTTMIVVTDAVGTLKSGFDANGGMFVNEQSGNVDSYIKGDTDPNLTYWDASTDRVGIGTNTPSEKLHVVGTLLATGLKLLIGGFNAIFTHSNSVDRTYTLPNYDGTLATLAGTETFTNKKFDDGVVINESGADSDTRIEGDTNPNLFCIDASADAAGVGTNAPDVSSIFHVSSTTKGSIALPVMTAAQRDAISSPAEGLGAYASDTEDITIYDGQRFRNVNSVGWTPHAFPVWHDPSSTFASTTVSLAANGGSLAIAVNVPAHMLLQSVTVRQASVATARTWAWDLYKQFLNNGNSGENTLTRVAASNGSDTFTPSAASNRTLDVSSAPVYLAPGVYWLVIQCRHATNAFVVGLSATPTLTSGNNYQTKTTTNPNGSTLDFVAATWTKSDNFVGVMLNGRVFGQTAAF